MRYLLSSVLLFLGYSLIQKASAQSSTASWQFPLQDGFTIDVIDTIILQWTSNYKEAWLLMWCQKNGPGEDVSLGMSLHSSHHTNASISLEHFHVQNI